jgi:hypothetical protein
MLMMQHPTSTCHFELVLPSTLFVIALPFMRERLCAVSFPSVLASVTYVSFPVSLASGTCMPAQSLRCPLSLPFPDIGMKM